MVHTATPTFEATEPASAVASIPNAEIPTPAPQEKTSLPEITPLYSTGFTPLSPKNFAQVSVIPFVSFLLDDFFSAPRSWGKANGLA